MAGTASALEARQLYSQLRALSGGLQTTTMWLPTAVHTAGTSKVWFVPVLREELGGSGYCEIPLTLTLRLFRPPPAAASTLFFTLLRMLNTSLTFTSACTEHTRQTCTASQMSADLLRACWPPAEDMAPILSLMRGQARL